MPTPLSSATCRIDSFCCMVTILPDLANSTVTVGAMKM